MNMKEFLTKLSADKVLAEKMSKGGNPEAVYAIAKDAGLSESFETFAVAMKKLNDASGEMSDANVDEIIGGADTTAIVTATVIISVPGGTVAAAAAAL